MRIVIFGLTVSSSWGNGHATLWRALIRSLGRDGHQVVFFERDVPYYAKHRDLYALPGCDIVLYQSWDDILPRARTELRRADAAMVTSYCPDAAEATRRVLESGAPVRAFYDLDAPVTLANLEAGREVAYIGPEGLAGFDLVLSYTGGVALEKIQALLGARQVAPLYGSVDPEAHHPVTPVEELRSDFSYLGTWAADRQAAVEKYFLEPARRRSDLRFLIGGAQYPRDFPWGPNLWYREHVPPPAHPAFFSSSRLTLNVTRESMARMGWCPSGRLFEAAACNVPLVSDWFEGLDAFFRPGIEILIARTTDDVMDALSLSDAELQRIRDAARERTLSEHTARHRARELVDLLESAALSDATHGRGLTVNP
ncbi:MAG: glycosyltransferase [Myxococcaceae bacterium]